MARRFGCSQKSARARGQLHGGGVANVMLFAVIGFALYLAYRHGPLSQSESQEIEHIASHQPYQSFLDSGYELATHEIENWRRVDAGVFRSGDVARFLFRYRRDGGDYPGRAIALEALDLSIQRQDGLVVTSGSAGRVLAYLEALQITQDSKYQKAVESYLDSGILQSSLPKAQLGEHLSAVSRSWFVLGRSEWKPVEDVFSNLKRVAAGFSSEVGAREISNVVSGALDYFAVSGNPDALSLALDVHDRLLLPLLMRGSAADLDVVGLKGLQRVASLRRRPKDYKTLQTKLDLFLSQDQLKSEELAALLFLASEANYPTREIALIHGSVSDAQPFLQIIRNRFLPHSVLVQSPKGLDFSSAISWLEGKAAISNRSTVYLCSDGVCQFPVTHPDKLPALLDKA